MHEGDIREEGTKSLDVDHPMVKQRNLQGVLPLRPIYDHLRVSSHPKGINGKPYNTLENFPQCHYLSPTVSSSATIPEEMIFPTRVQTDKSLTPA